MIGPSKKRVFSAALILIGAAALSGWVVSPHVGYLHAMQRLEPVVGQMVQQRERIQGTLEEKLRTLRTLQRELVETGEGCFTRGQFKAFTYNLQSLVEQAGCSIVIVEFTHDADARQGSELRIPGAIHSLRVDVTVWGYYDQIIALLERLQDNQPMVRVDSFRTDLLSGQGGQLECRIALAACVLSEERESCW